MVSYVFIASAVIMGLLAVAAFAATALWRDWFDYRPQISPPERGTISRLATDFRVWVLGFILLVGLLTGAVLAAVGGGNVGAILGLLGLLVVGFLILGVYSAGRSRGHPHAHAVGEAIIALATVVLLGIAVNLLTSFGA